MDGFIEDRASEPPDPDPERVKARAKELRRERPEMDDAEAEAAAKRLLKESDARTTTDPAPNDLSEDRVERRTSKDATPPPESD